jgi:hypothetical protein
LVSDDVPPPRRRDDWDAERRVVFLVFFVVGHSDGILIFRVAVGARVTMITRGEVAS